MANLKIGDIVYAIYDDDIITKGTVQEYMGESEKNINTYKIDVGYGPVPNIYLEQNLFRTKTEAAVEVKRRRDNAIKRYMSEITDVSSLVSFCLNHCVACAEEYTNWNAREAVKIKAKELGLTLNIEW